MAGLEQHGQHAPPQVGRLDLLEQLDLAARRLVFVGRVGDLEGAAELVVQIGAGAGREQGQSPPSITRFINRSGTQLAVFM
jgi:hypothetical protein